VIKIISLRGDITVEKHLSKKVFVLSKYLVTTVKYQYICHNTMGAARGALVPWSSKIYHFNDVPLIFPT